MKKKLLLADDSITIQKVVGIIFAPENYDLLVASDGDKAYEMALSHRPDLVIADIAMPGRNGFELCREIKSNPTLGQTSVLLLPGVFEAFDESRAVDVCADGWLTKPFESQALLDKVAALCDMPPLRLVPAEEADVDVALMEADDKIAEELVVAVEEESIADQEELVALTQEESDVIDDETDADDGLWGEVSFEEDDLKPQDLLAATEQDDDEVTVDPSEDESPATDFSAGLTPEQLAPYVSTDLPADVREEVDAPEFEPLIIEEEQETVEEQEFGFISDDAQELEDPEVLESADTRSDIVEDVEEDSLAPFDFSGPEVDDSQQDDEDPQAIIEMMEEDFDQEEDLVEDPDTFIELNEADEDASLTEDAPAVFSATADNEEVADQEDILELTEGDIVSDSSSVALAEEDDTDDDVLVVEQDSDGDEITDEDVFDEALVDTTEESDQLAVFDEDQIDEDEIIEVEAGPEITTEESGRDDDLFVDEEEETFTAETASDDVADVEPEPAVPSVPGATSVAATIEEQLQQLSQDELKEVVAKVAGPMIEALAREMLEQTVWEVVPDLAETMISAEIEKIKRGEI